MLYKKCLIAGIVAFMPYVAVASERADSMAGVSRYWALVTGVKNSSWASWTRSSPVTIGVPLWQQGTGLCAGASLVGLRQWWRVVRSVEVVWAAAPAPVPAEPAKPTVATVQPAVNTSVTLSSEETSFIWRNAIDRLDVMNGHRLPIFKAAKGAFGLEDYLKFEMSSGSRLKQLPGNVKDTDRVILEMLLQEPDNLWQQGKSGAWKSKDNYFAWFKKQCKDSDWGFESLRNSLETTRDTVLNPERYGRDMSITANRVGTSALAQLMYLTYMRHDSQLIAAKGEAILQERLDSCFGRGSEVERRALIDFGHNEEVAQRLCKLAREKSEMNIRGEQDSQKPLGDMWQAMMVFSAARLANTESLLREKLVACKKLKSVLDLYSKFPGAVVIPENDQEWQTFERNPLQYKKYAPKSQGKTDISLDDDNIGRLHRYLLKDLNVLA